MAKVAKKETVATPVTQDRPTLTRNEGNFSRLILSLMFCSSIPDDRVENEQEQLMKSAARQALSVFLEEPATANLYQNLIKNGAVEGTELTGRGRSMAMAGFNAKTGPRKYTGLDFAQLCAAQQPKGKLSLLAAWVADWKTWKQDHDFTPSEQVKSLFEDAGDFLLAEAGIEVDDVE